MNHRNAFILGALAGAAGISALAFRDTDAGYGEWAFFAGLTMFVASFVAVRRDPAREWVAFRAVIGGVAAGIAAHAIIHAGLFGGSRSVWPFEIILFLFFGILPALVGLALARQFEAKRT